LDTREKIVSLESAQPHLAGGNWIVVAGFFDPLTAVQANRLAQLANSGDTDGKLFAIVLERDDALLPADARAALVAALREVKLVSIADSTNWRSMISDGANIRIVEDVEGEKARSEEFVQFILGRQQTAADPGLNQ
jgi:hypothetical protein